MHVWRSPLTDFGQTGQCSASSHECKGPFDGTKTGPSTFLDSCATEYVASRMLWWQPYLNVCVSRLLVTEGLSTGPGQTCWSQGWSSRSLDRPSDCQSQSSSRRNGPLTRQMWSSELHSSPRNSHCKTNKNAFYTMLIIFSCCKVIRLNFEVVSQRLFSKITSTYEVTSLLFHLFSWWSYMSTMGSKQLIVNLLLSTWGEKSAGSRGNSDLLSTNIVNITFAWNL